jgi:hypothetical protein
MQNVKEKMSFFGFGAPGRTLSASPQRRLNG